MTRKLISVFYEDQLAGAKPNNYGPHALLLACVADQCQENRWALHLKVIAIPKKGDSKLRAALRDDAGLIAQGGRVFALFDLDRVRNCYELAPNACKRTVLDAIAAEATGAPAIVLLEQHMETVVEACCAASNRPLPTAKPSPAERDSILHGIAAGDRGMRDAVLTSVPSFDRLVRIVNQAIAEMST